MRRHLTVAVLSALGSAAAQSNTIPGLDVRQTNIEDPRYFGRRGAYPTGEIGIAYSYYLCNTGSVAVAWEGPFNGMVNGQPGLRPNHPFWAFMVVREGDGRIVQISGDSTFVKHATSAANSALCGACAGGTSSALGVGCSDAYGQNTNANRFWLGPRDEVDPWLGVWSPVGSYFDRGDPDVGFPANGDQIRSLTSAQVAAFDGVKNRITLKEADLLAPGRFFYFMHMLVKGEAAGNRHDNYGYREMTSGWDGSVWSFANAGPYAFGSPLNAWPGAAVSMARNGNDDGHFIVAVKVTGPSSGLYHYEYAVHDLDNGRGAATFRVPVCGSTAVANVGFRDRDLDPLSDWTWSRTPDELVFSATANNALEWNELFNFWFDCATGPVAGAVALDQALPGPGAPSVSIGTQVPGGSALVADLGPGCGTPSPAIGGIGLPTLGNAAFGISIATAPNSGVFLLASLARASLPIAPGCTQYLGGSLVAYGFVATNAAGQAAAPVAIPPYPWFEGQSLYLQAVQLVNGGPLFGQFTLGNGLHIRAGCR